MRFIGSIAAEFFPEQIQLPKVNRYRPDNQSVKPNFLPQRGELLNGRAAADLCQHIEPVEGDQSQRLSPFQRPPALAKAASITGRSTNF